jgi:hypothetical protein
VSPDFTHHLINHAVEVGTGPELLKPKVKLGFFEEPGFAELVARGRVRASQSILEPALRLTEVARSAGQGKVAIVGINVSHHAMKSIADATKVTKSNFARGKKVKGKLLGSQKSSQNGFAT